MKRTYRCKTSSLDIAFREGFTYQVRSVGVDECLIDSHTDVAFYWNEELSAATNAKGRVIATFEPVK